MPTIYNFTTSEQHSQQLEVYAQQGITDKDLRKATVEVLRDLILKQFYTPDNYLLIGVNTNESSQMKQNPSIFDMFSSIGLHDAIEHLNGEHLCVPKPTTAPSKSSPTEERPHLHLRPTCNLCPTKQQLSAKHVQHQCNAQASKTAHDGHTL